jgi:hypothetical protein
MPRACSASFSAATAAAAAPAPAAQITHSQLWRYWVATKPTRHYRTWQQPLHGPCIVEHKALDLVEPVCCQGFLHMIGIADTFAAQNNMRQGLQGPCSPVVAVCQPPDVSLKSPFGLMRTIFVLWNRKTVSVTPAQAARQSLATGTFTSQNNVMHWTMLTPLLPCPPTHSLALPPPLSRQCLS